MTDQAVESTDLTLDWSTSLAFETITLDDVRVFNQWGFFFDNCNCDAMIKDSQGVWLK